MFECGVMMRGCECGSKRVIVEEGKLLRLVIFVVDVMIRRCQVFECGVMMRRRQVRKNIYQ